MLLVLQRNPAALNWLKIVQANYDWKEKRGPDFMARGWESKQVELQMEEGREKQTAAADETSADDKKMNREKQNLLLSRAYIQHQMESSSNSRYTESLKKALEEIERKLADLTSNG